MDYRAVGELIWFGLLGLSVFTVVTGFTVRAFLAPLFREGLAALSSSRSEEQARSDARLELLESRLLEMETEMRRVAAAEEFHRQLRAPRADEGGSGGES